MQKMPITPEGLRRLEDELRHLKSEERPAVIKAIAEAREHGDLSENAEYHAAREKQSFIEGRVAQLEGLISSAEVIDPSMTTGTRIRFGAHIEVADEETGKEQSFQIVGVPEADIKVGRISISSPIARALIGKDEGDSATVPAPGGDKSYEIIKVTYR
ncbi:transcription elongation factor GreA [Acetobacteraceae bacterium]|nr:transcription elongation factor GreA [Acetobacteraceae bacterium]